ncbi:MAG: hypothetical protein QXH97_00275 [Candidatus Bathyarchaeia archaeon]
MSVRARRWIKRTDPELVAQAYKASRNTQMETGTIEQLFHDMVFNRVRPLITSRVSNPYMVFPYLSYAQQIAYISVKSRGAIAIRKATARAWNWYIVGLEAPLLIEIAKLFNLNIEMEFRKHMAQLAKLDVIPITGTAYISHTNLEITLLSFEDDRTQGVEGFLRISRMGSPDVVEISEYIKLSPNSDFSLYNRGEIDLSTIDEDTIRIAERIVRYGYRVTIKAINYAPRDVDISFNRIIYGW